MWLKAVFLLLVRLTTGLESDGLSKCMWRKEKSEVRKERARLLWESAKDLLSNSGWRENSWSKSRGKWCVVHLYVIEGDAELGVLRDGDKTLGGAAGILPWSWARAAHAVSSLKWNFSVFHCNYQLPDLFIPSLALSIANRWIHWLRRFCCYDQNRNV